MINLKDSEQVIPEIGTEENSLNLRKNIGQRVLTNMVKIRKISN